MSIQKYVDNGFIRQAQKNNLTLYCYTDKTEWEKKWDEVTLTHRGHIYDNNGNLVARPFDKFGHLESLEKVPSGRPVIQEKLDGSLIVVWFHDNKWNCSTKGSFDSEQALVAQELLDTVYSDYLSDLNPEHTYMFEVIYPGNRIVVDYGDTKKLVLLAIRNIKTGEYLDIYQNKTKFEKVKSYDFLDWKNLKNQVIDNFEGFVLVFPDGTRAKVKLDEYVRIHSAMSQMSEKKLINAIINNIPLATLLDGVPDETFDFWRQKEKEIMKKVNLIYNEIVEWSKSVPDGDQKAKARYIFTSNYKYKNLVMNHIKGKDIKNDIIKIC